MPDEQAPKEEEKEEPCLVWEFNRWQVESEDTLTFVWISDATFKRYLAAELEARGADASKQGEAVVYRCQKLSFWLEHENDPDVNVRRFGRAYLEHQRKLEEHND